MSLPGPRRVTRAAYAAFAPRKRSGHGRIRRGRDGKLRFDYDDRSEYDDEVGFRLNNECFVPGEYVSVLECAGRMHTF